MIYTVALPPPKFLMILVFDSHIWKSDQYTDSERYWIHQLRIFKFHHGKNRHFSKDKICFPVNSLQTEMSYSSLYSQGLVIVNAQWTAGGK